ncbi:MAG: hydroxymethylglutaryl-CoA lyase [Bacteroidetes bacterium]|nr:hydroxymethylglutaryl-CoA lyase [Bacteroidota bacterium]
MQGIKGFIPTEKKIAYINKLLEVGYHSIDFGSFVSHEKIPQMADTALVVEGLQMDNTDTQLIAIIANERGARQACAFPKIDCLGFPFSISETFQRRNANSTIEEALDRVKSIKDLTLRHNKELIIYLSMGFGNPYGDAYHPDIVFKWTEQLAKLDIKIFMLSDTVGVGEPKGISELFSFLVPAFPQLEFGAHLHTAPHNWRVKIDAAYQNGCRRFDAAIHGYGGCPMADDDLIGNMPTENLVNYFTDTQIEGPFSLPAFESCLREANRVFPKH